METTFLKPMTVKRLKFGIVGMSPLIQHSWNEKSIRQMREKHAGKKTKDREVRNPEKEAGSCVYRTNDGKFGTPLLAIKGALISAAHKDLGIEKTLVKKSLFIQRYDSSMVLPFASHSEPQIREDCVRVGMGQPDLRYRYQFDEWAIDLDIEWDADLLQKDDIGNLLMRAGFGVGICEWRPEKGGEFGRFMLA